MYPILNSVDKGGRNAGYKTQEWVDVINNRGSDTIKQYLRSMYRQGTTKQDLIDVYSVISEVSKNIPSVRLTWTFIRTRRTSTYSGVN